ncbi:MAG: diguanylate cyclase [Clostridium sp.]
MKHKQKIGNIIFILLVTAVLMVTAWDFLIQLQRTLTRETYRTLNEVSEHYNEAFLDRIEYNIKTLNVVAGSLKHAEDQSQQSVTDILQNAVDNGGFITIAICAPDGSSYANNGTTADVSNRDYFNNAMQGKIGVSEPITSMVNGKETIIISVPIQDEGNVKGVLLGVYPTSIAGKQLLDSAYYNDGYGFIIAPSGDIVLSGDYVDMLCKEKNLFSFFEKADMLDFSVAELKKAIERGESKSFAFTYNGERRFVNFMPSTINNWYTFSVASDALMLEQEKITNRIVIRLVIKLVIVGFFLLVWIIIENRRHNRELRLSEQRFSIAINASSGALFEVDMNKQLYTHFENPERIFGETSEKLLADTQAFSSLPHEEFVDAVTRYFFHPDDWNVTKKAMRELLEKKTESYEARLRRGDGSYIWARIDLILSLNQFGVPIRLLGYMSDIDDIKKQAELLEIQAQTDSMTGVYNKVAMTRLADRAMADDPTGLHALIVLDVDNFKGINDTLGHAFGDVVLIEVCAKLKTLCRSDDIIGRVGGDEFAILMKHVPDTSLILKKAAEIAGAFRQSYASEKGDYKISCSMGIIMIDQADDSYETLYRKADAALYQAKQNGKDQFVLYQEKDAAYYPMQGMRISDGETQNLKEVHNIEEHIFELLYTSKDFDISVNMALAAIGQQYHVSRAYIFENDIENQYTVNTYEWCNSGITPEISHLEHVEIYSGNESLLDSYDDNGLLYCNDIRELPSYWRSILEPQGILSTLQRTIVNNGKVYGFIGFDECTKYRIWTSEEIEKLSFLSKILSIFWFKEKTEVALLDNLKTRLKILDILPDYICVVNPEKHAVEYANKKMKQLIPEVQVGSFCFITLRGGQEAPCKTCLVERIKRGDTDNLEIVNESKDVHLKVDAISITWTNNQKMVLLYGTAPSIEL